MRLIDHWFRQRTKPEAEEEESFMDCLVKVKDTAPKIDREEVAKTLAEYRSVKEPTPHDLKVIEELEGYENLFRLIERNGTLIDLDASVKRADGDRPRRASLPTLAIGLVSQAGSFVHAEYSHMGGITYSMTIEREKHRFRPDLVKRWTLAFSGLEGWHYGEYGDSNSRTSTGDAVVPMVPPRFRNLVRRGDLIAFEPTWTNVKEPRPKPVDPAILRSAGGGMYELVAEWDLTAVEARALGLTARRV